jgi:hypothetical protein
VPDAVLEYQQWRDGKLAVEFVVFGEVAALQATSLALELLKAAFYAVNDPE